MKQNQLIQMHLESEMTPEEIATFRAKIAELSGKFEALHNSNETEIDKAAYVVALTRHAETME